MTGITVKGNNVFAIHAVHLFLSELGYRSDQYGEGEKVIPDILVIDDIRIPEVGRFLQEVDTGRPLILIGRRTLWPLFRHLSVKQMSVFIPLSLTVDALQNELDIALRLCSFRHSALQADETRLIHLRYQILGLLLAGKTPAGISEGLQVSVKSVSREKQAALKSLGLRNFQQLALLLTPSGGIQIPESQGPEALFIGNQQAAPAERMAEYLATVQ